MRARAEARWQRRDRRCCLVTQYPKPDTACTLVLGTQNEVILGSCSFSGCYSSNLFKIFILTQDHKLVQKNLKLVHAHRRTGGRTTDAHTQHTRGAIALFSLLLHAPPPSHRTTASTAIRSPPAPHTTSNRNTRRRRAASSRSESTNHVLPPNGCCSSSIILTKETQRCLSQPSNRMCECLLPILSIAACLVLDPL